MMTVDQIVSAFREIVGWPYTSPDSNRHNGEGSSIAFVYAYEKHGYSIDHGSNRIIRKYCHDVQRISEISQLQPGMVLFSSRKNRSRLSAQYQPGGRYYDRNLPDDYEHIGLVVSVAPLQIINATTPVPRITTQLSQWSHAGYLDAVDYASASLPSGGASRRF